MGKTQSEIEELLSGMEIREENYQPEINYNIDINLDKLLLGALKIAYEYMYLVFGNQFYEDETAEEIRMVLYEATTGKFDRKYSEMCFTPKEIIALCSKYKEICPNAHILYLIKDVENKLMVNITLFGNDFLSFSICVSKDASKYNLDKNRLVIIDIVNQEIISL